MAQLDLLNDFWRRTEREARFRPYNEHMRRARPFTLDQELAQLVGDLAYQKATDRALSRYLSSSRLPFPVMWIEATYADAFRHRLSAPDAYEWGEPDLVGWLLIENPAIEGAFSATRVARVPDPEDGEWRASVYPLMHLVSPERRFKEEDYSVFGALSRDMDQRRRCGG